MKTLWVKPELPQGWHSKGSIPYTVQGLDALDRLTLQDTFQASWRDWIIDIGWSEIKEAWHLQLIYKRNWDHPFSEMWVGNSVFVIARITSVARNITYHLADLDGE